MKYFNTDTVADHFIKLWEDSNDEEFSDDGTVYEPDNNDDGFYDEY